MPVLITYMQPVSQAQPLHDPQCEPNFYNLSSSTDLERDLSVHLHTLRDKSSGQLSLPHGRTSSDSFEPIHHLSQSSWVSLSSTDDRMNEDRRLFLTQSPDVSGRFLPLSLTPSKILPPLAPKTDRMPNSGRPTLAKKQKRGRRKWLPPLGPPCSTLASGTSTDCYLTNPEVFAAHLLTKENM